MYKMACRIGFEPMVLPEWEQIYSLSASTACIPVQNFRWFTRVPTSQWATTFAF